MQTGKTQKAKLKSTGDEIDVYKHSISNKYVNANDCTTMYEPEELIFRNNQNR